MSETEMGPKRLAEIREMVENRKLRWHPIVHEMLAEIDRLRAANNALHEDALFRDLTP